MQQCKPISPAKMVCGVAGSKLQVQLEVLRRDQEDLAAPSKRRKKMLAADAT